MLCLGFALGGFLFYRHVNRRRRASQQGIHSQASRKAALASTVPHENEVSLCNMDHPSLSHPATNGMTLLPRPAPAFPYNQSLYSSSDQKGVPIRIHNKAECFEDLHSSSSSFAQFSQSVQSSSSTASAPHLPSLHFIPPDGDIAGHTLGIDGQPTPSTQSQPPIKSVESSRVSDKTPLSDTPAALHNITICEGNSLQTRRVPYDQWRFGL